MIRNKWIVLSASEERLGVVTAFDKQRAIDQARKIVDPSQGFYVERMSDEELSAMTPCRVCDKLPEDDHTPETMAAHEAHMSRHGWSGMCVSPKGQLNR